MCSGGGGEGEGGREGVGEGQASISKPTSFIYLTFEKNRLIHILDRLKFRPIHILPFVVVYIYNSTV